MLASVSSAMPVRPSSTARIIPGMHLLANVVIRNTEQAYDTRPRANNLPCQLMPGVLPIRANTEQSTDDGKTDAVADDDGVV